MKLFLVKSVLNLFSFILCSILKQQGGAVYIKGGSGTFTSCAFTGNTGSTVSSFFKYPCTIYR